MPLQTMSYSDFEKLLNGPNAKYYAGRWPYYKAAIEFVAGSSAESVLEVGPGLHTIVNGCDVLARPEDDYWGRPDRSSNRVILHDATESPWPFDDKTYDLIVALQVWEHLDNKQSRAFREAMRVSRMAVLSLPYLWDCPKDNPNYPEHHMIDRELIGDWTLGVEPEAIAEVPRSGERLTQGPKIVYFWRFS